MAYTYADIAKMIDHSLLNPTLTGEALEAGCEVALEYDVASVCILPYYLGRCAEVLKGSGVRASTTIGFPHAGHTTAVKLTEARQAIADGGEELDMVVNVSRALSGDWGYVGGEIGAIVEAAHGAGRKVKVIFENCYLDDAQKVRLCEICGEAGADWVKTSTGYGTGGATTEDLRLMRPHSPAHVQVKAAGGVLLVTLARGPEAALNLGRALLGLCQEQWNSLVYGPKVADLGLAVAALPKVVCETVVDQEVKWFNVVPAGLVAVGLWASLRRKEKVAWVSVVALVGFLVLLGRAAVAPRYLLPVLPLLAYFLLRGVHETAAWVKARRRRAAVGRGEGAAEPTERRARVALTVTVAICLAVSLPKVFREIYWMRHPQFYEVYQKGRWQQWIEACAYLRARGRPGDVVGTTETSVVHYLSGLRFRSETFRVEPDNPDTWQYGFGNLTGFPPRVFAEATAKSEIRFLVIPTDLRRTSDSWSESAMRAIEAQGAFGSPPKRFGNVAVYERLAAREAAP